MMSLASHDKMSHVASPFAHLDLTSQIVPLTVTQTSMALHDQKQLHNTLFQASEVINTMML